MTKATYGEKDCFAAHHDGKGIEGVRSMFSFLSSPQSQPRE